MMGSEIMHRKTLTTMGAQMDDWSAGDWGGAFAGVVAMLAAIGKGLAWLLDWNRAGLTSREMRLQRWEESLAGRERAYREEIEQHLAETRVELDKVERTVGLMRAVLAEVMTELRHHVPDSPALTRAADALKGN
jgi:uncharacterized coiled-coil protein SlyX